MTDTSKKIRFYIQQMNGSARIEIHAKSHLGAMAVFMAEVVDSRHLGDLPRTGAIFTVRRARDRISSRNFLVHPYSANTGFTVRPLPSNPGMAKD